MSNQVHDPPLVLGRYALIRLLGRGGMGSVYLGRVEGAAGFRKPVAIKLIHQHLMDDESAVQSFVREAKLVVRLAHPNIVQVLDFGEHNGQYLTILEYVQGHDLGVLTKYLRQTGRAMSVDHAGLVLYRVLRGLEFAHDLAADDGTPLGLVHRDISPQNIMISTDGQILVTDFGIARIKTEVTRSGHGELKGKLAYLSPEQVSNRPVDRRSDLFALGIVLYEVLSGERLFHSDSEAQTIMRVARAEIPDVRAIRPDLPAAVAAVLGRALARDPADRYQTAAEFARDVRHQLLSAAPDELEASFRDMVRRSVAEDSFVEYAGRLPDLAHELTAAPLALAGLGATATRRHARDESSATTRRPAVATRARQTRLVLFLVVVGVTLLAALASGAVLFGLGPQRGGAATGDQPVKVIVENRGAPPPAGGAETEPAAATPGGAARGLPSPVADAAPLADASVPGADAGVDISKTPRTSLTPLDGRRVSRTLMSRRRALLACFEQGSAGAEQVKNVVIRLEVGGDGAVRWAKVEPASVDGTRMGKCLAAVASTTRFPRHPESALVFRVPIAVSQE